MPEMGKCPKCRASIPDTHPYSWCANCGEPLPPDIAASIPAVAARRSSAADSSSSASQPGNVAAPDTRRLVVRCRDGYTAATFLVAVGAVVKGTGELSACSSNSVLWLSPTALAGDLPPSSACSLPWSSVGCSTLPALSSQDRAKCYVPRLTRQSLIPPFSYPNG